MVDITPTAVFFRQNGEIVSMVAVLNPIREDGYEADPDIKASRYIVNKYTEEDEDGLRFYNEEWSDWELDKNSEFNIFKLNYQPPERDDIKIIDITDNDDTPEKYYQAYGEYYQERTLVLGE